MEKISLYFTEGSTDKIYQTTVKASGEGYMVHFAYGRRGSTLITGTKTQGPVPYAEAKRIYEKLVKEKTAKGYTPGGGGTAYQEKSGGLLSTGIHCQLLSPIDESQVERLINDPALWMQEKFDGRRLLVQKRGRTITGINKLGFPVAVPETIEKAAKGFYHDFVIDGEAVGDDLYAFDLLNIGGKDVRGRSYADRSLGLINLLASNHQDHVLMVQSAFMAGQKRLLLDECREGGKEGVVFKRFDQSYIAGRAPSQFKFKFCESASCLVGKINAKRSVRLELFDGDQLVSVGNVSISVKHEIPTVGSVVERRYLYAFRGNNLIYELPTRKSAERMINFAVLSDREARSGLMRGFIKD